MGSISNVPNLHAEIIYEIILESKYFYINSQCLRLSQKIAFPLCVTPHWPLSIIGYIYLPEENRTLILSEIWCGSLWRKTISRIFEKLWD